MLLVPQLLLFENSYGGVAVVLFISCALSLIIACSFPSQATPCLVRSATFASVLMLRTFLHSFKNRHLALQIFYWFVAIVTVVSCIGVGLAHHWYPLGGMDDNAAVLTAFIMSSISFVARWCGMSWMPRTVMMSSIGL